MKPRLQDIDTTHLAFVTGHKLTKVHRQYVSAMLGNVYFGTLDNGRPERLTDIRKRLELEYFEAEARQGQRQMQAH